MRMGSTGPQPHTCSTIPTGFPERSPWFQRRSCSMDPGLGTWYLHENSMFRLVGTIYLTGSWFGIHLPKAQLLSSLRPMSLWLLAWEVEGLLCKKAGLGGKPMPTVVGSKPQRKGAVLGHCSLARAALQPPAQPLPLGSLAQGTRGAIKTLW